EVALTVNHIAIALLERDYRPAHACQYFPEENPQPVDGMPGFTFVTVIKRGAGGDASGFPVEPRKAPAFAAKPADVFVRITPAGKFPIENPGQGGAIQHVVAGAEIMVAEHWRHR